VDFDVCRIDLLDGIHLEVKPTVVPERVGVAPTLAVAAAPPGTMPHVEWLVIVVVQASLPAIRVGTLGARPTVRPGRFGVADRQVWTGGEAIASGTDAVYGCCMSSTRTQVYLTEEQRRKIDQLADAEGVTMAVIIRRALDDYLTDDADASTALSATFGAAPDADAPSRDEWQRG